MSGIAESESDKIAKAGVNPVRLPVTARSYGIRVGFMWDNVG
jgi:hypothetical protein